jgi:hypothetical protein
MTPTGDAGDAGDAPSVGKVIAVMAGFAALGFPLVFEIWETVNDVLTGHSDAVKLQWFIPALIAFPILLVVLGRVVRRLTGE